VNDVEDVLRETMRAHEWMAGDGGGLADAASGLARVRRRRRQAAVAVAASVVAVSVGGVLAVSAVTGPARRPAATAAPALPPAPPGWRWESSLGVEMAVPGDWLVNDYGCGESAASTVVRGGGGGFALACFPIEPRTKQVAIIADDHQELDFPGFGEVHFRAHPSGTLRLPDGRYAGWRWLADRRAVVSARTRSAALTRQILATAHGVDVDRNGCAAKDSPVGLGRDGRLARRLVPGRPTSLAVCWYFGLQADSTRVLTASWSAGGAELDRLITALNTASPGRNPDLPGCEPSRTPDAIILARYPDGGTVPLTTTLEGCGRGIDNGRRQVRLTVRLIQRLADPLHTGYTLDEDIPQQ
jgi:hypothetical protein